MFLDNSRRDGEDKSKGKPAMYCRGIDILKCQTLRCLGFNALGVQHFFVHLGLKIEIAQRTLSHICQGFGFSV